MSTSKQRQQIGHLRKLIGLDYDTYQEMLSIYGVESSKNLTDKNARSLIQDLKGNAIRMGVYIPTKQYAFQQFKYDNLGHREGMATPKQLRMIEAMWKDVSKKETESERQSSLKVFIKRITNKEHFKFISQEDIQKLVKALKTMKGNQK
ncbi:MAG: regulatory protein GemA [Candidatus Gastranaerophilales bacterium]|nr:regulatory protein GemA [Candidatus Gastranaerophilales bacterium]